MIQDNANKILDSENSRGALWLGNLAAANSKSFIEDENIKTVITAAVGQPVSYLNQQIFHKVVPIIDEEYYIISKHFNDLNRVIDKQLNLGSVLVHCAAGISRSATIVIAYLIGNLHWTLETSLIYVKQKRKKIKPNKGFLEQLQYYEGECRKKTQRQNQLQLKIQQNSFSRKEMLRIIQVSQLNPQCLFHLEKCRSLSREKQMKAHVVEKSQIKNKEAFIEYMDVSQDKKPDNSFYESKKQQQQVYYKPEFRIKSVQSQRVQTQSNNDENITFKYKSSTQHISSPLQKSQFKKTNSNIKKT